MPDEPAEVVADTAEISIYTFGSLFTPGPCPRCGETSFLAWRIDPKPYVVRCLNCLNRWETEESPKKDS